MKCVQLKVLVSDHNVQAVPCGMRPTPKPPYWHSHSTLHTHTHTQGAPATPLRCQEPTESGERHTHVFVLQFSSTFCGADAAQECSRVHTAFLLHNVVVGCRLSGQHHLVSQSISSTTTSLGLCFFMRWTQHRSSRDGEPFSKKRDHAQDASKVWANTPEEGLPALETRRHGLESSSPRSTTMSQSEQASPCSLQRPAVLQCQQIFQECVRHVACMCTVKNTSVSATCSAETRLIAD